MKKIISILTISLFLVLSANAALAADVVKLTVGTGTATSTAPASINITATPTTGSPTVAGAAFTLRYDSSLTVTVDNTTFFDTFVNQGFTAGQDGLDANELVSGFDSPFVTNAGTEGTKKLTRIAAARKDAGAIAAGGTVLFTLSVEGTVAGTFAIEIIPTIPNPNSEGDTNAAGWSVGEMSDLLIGVDTTPGTTDPFPVRLAKADTANMDAGSVIVKGDVMVDSDSDGIDDSWEMTYFGDLTTADATTDYDQDGYKDVDEYLNSIAGQDANGNDYNPNFMNPPGGTNSTTPSYVLGDVNMDGAIGIDDVKRSFELFGGAAPVSQQEYRLANPCPADEDIQPTITDVKALFVLFGGGDPYAGTCQ
ncbi:EF-Hand calcium-binding site-containing [Desulfonema limicola]|uniref:EF-Hand calcium-binding site-containing n=1 Tax=Desulfonema limicola TaxID=45656 RepID=A0A975GEW2_9BACT|nr:hypothetical protein [Desulfonema limicola]QTA78555.1 EF-Hand calcium-binding site-containing [Desulfonema limicola]